MIHSHLKKGCIVLKNDKNKKDEEVLSEETQDVSSDDATEATDAMDQVEDVEVVSETETETIEVVSLDKQLEQKELELKEQLDRNHRTLAEFDNFRKRTLKEKDFMYEKGAKEILEVLLPIVDNFERAFDAVTDEHKEDSFVKGINMIYKQLITALKEMGVEEIEALGQVFDPHLHHAVQHETSEDHDESIVAAVYQKGYKYKDSVLRYSMVKVVN